MPGLLAIVIQEIKNHKTGKINFEKIKFVVPGGRFNKLYDWDSYIIALGLFQEDLFCSNLPENKQINLAKFIIIHFVFSI